MGHIKQVQSRYVEHHARRAITQRLGYRVPQAVISLTRDDAVAVTVILHVTSGGNARATERHLRSLGYRVEPTNYDSFAQGRYAVQLRVGPAAEAVQEM